MARRPIEPLLWILFSAGGTLAALLIPVLLALFGLMFPLGWLPPPSHAHLVAVLGHPVVRVGLFLLCTLSLFHWAHRFRFVVHHQLGIHGLRRLVAVACYGSATAGTAISALVLLRI